MSKEVFIKVDVKDELPKESAVYGVLKNGHHYDARYDVEKNTWYTLTPDSWLKPAPLSSLMGDKERFKMPTDEQIIDIAILMTVEKNQVNKKELANILATCNFILDRLYENNDIMIPSSKE